MAATPARKRGGRRTVRETAIGYTAFGARQRVARVVEVFGNKVTAELMNVSQSQPSRWRNGRERVAGENLQRLVELDYVASRLLLQWAPEVVRDWLGGDNPHVGGRPIDVLRLHGPEALRPALDALQTGAYA